MTIRSFPFLLLAVLSILALPVTANDGAKPASQSPREATAAGFRYLVYETAGASPDAILPMIVGLHYSSAQPESMLEYFDGIDFPARIVLPQGEYSRRDGYSWFPTDYAQLSATQQDAAVFDAERRLSAFVETATAKYATRGKPVVMGISYGGDLAFLLAIRHPETLRAAFPVAARFLPAWMPEANTCKPQCPPIHAMHGDKDTTVPIAPTREAAARLKEMGFNVELAPYAGVPHDFNERMKEDFTNKVKSLLVTDP